MKYSAFISYNHRDRKIAGWLHQALETYRVPKALRGRESPLGVLGKRLPPVFQDREELAASTDLAASVLTALENSASLIVICTPNGRRSRWVNEEIRTFTKMGRRHRIQCLIAGGEPNASNVPGMDPELEALPPALFENGETEPLGADVRDGQDGKLNGKLKLLAGLLDVRYDELRQREAIRRQRQLTMIAAGSAVGFVAMSGLTAAALFQRGEAIKQRDIARQKTLTAERTVEFVKSIFAISNPSEAQGASITAREILDRGAARIDAGLEREPTVKAELGTTLGEVYTNLGLLHDGERLIRRMLRVQGVSEETRTRQYIALAQVRAWQADDAAAIKHYRTALSLARRDRARPEQVAFILNSIGVSQSWLGQYDTAEANIRAALAMDRRSGAETTAVARDLEALATNDYAQQRWAAARQNLEHARGIRLKISGPRDPEAIKDLTTLGSVAYQQHDGVGAERLYRESLTATVLVLGPNHPEVATALNNLAATLVERRAYSEALPLTRRAVAINVAQRDETSTELVFLYTNLGLALRGVGDAKGGEAAFEKALTAARLHNHRNLAPILVNLADVSCSRGDLKRGLARLTEAAPIMAKTYPNDPWRSAWVEVIRGGCLSGAGEGEHAAAVIAAAAPAMTARWPRGSHYGARTAELLSAAKASGG